MFPTGRTLHRAVAAAAAATALLAGCLLLAPQASAHDVLVATDPAQESAVAAAPARVVLTFDKPALRLGTQIRVTGPGGVAVSAGRPRLVDTTVTEDLAGALPAGAYVVTWRVTSADGHPVSGRFGYTAAAAGQGALAASALATAPAPAPAPEKTSRSGVSLPWVLVAALVGLLALGAGTAAILRRRR